MPIGHLPPAARPDGTPVQHFTPWGVQTAMRPADIDAVLAVPLSPSSDWLDYSNHSSARYLLGENTLALELARIAVRLNRNSSTLVNLALILEAFGRFHEARPFSEEAYALDPSNPTVLGNVAEARLRMGDWPSGWPLYALAYAQMGHLRQFIPEWTGRESLRGKTILVFESGGVGDTFFFMRWFYRLKSWGARVLFACHEPLASFMRSQPCVDEVLVEHKCAISHLPVREVDYFTATMALGECLNVTTDDVLWRGPYITPPSPSPVRTRARVGLCWKAGEYLTPRPRRSLTPAQRDLLIAHSLVRLVNLQYGESDPRMEQPDISGWSNPAAVISQLDLVISVDTATAHLAAAMGVPTWTLLPAASAPLFLLDTPTHPCYPSMRLFRSRGCGIDDAVDQASRALEDL